MLPEIYKEVAEINVKDPASVEDRFCKLIEEYGELVMALNKTIGRKSTDQSEAEVKQEILEECADTIQTLFSCMDEANEQSEGAFEELHFSDEDVLKVGDSPELTIQNLIIILHNSISAITYPAHVVQADPYHQITALVTNIANRYGFTLEDIVETIKVKNQKWLKLID